MNILIVDDEPSYLHLLEVSFRLEGWTVFSAADGLQGLKRLSEARMDLIISDIYMPVMDGFKLHAKVRELPDYKTTPFIFVSGFKDQNTMSAISKTANDAFVEKTNPLSFLKEWVYYLITPIERRPSLPPIEKPSQTYDRRMRDDSYHRRR